MSSGQHGGRFDFHDSVRVHEPPHLQERHRGEVPSHEAAVHLTERLQARDIRLPVRDIDGQSADLLGPASGRAHDLQHPLERAGPLLDEPGALGGGLSGDEQYPPAGRGEHAVIPAARSAERIGIDDAEGHRREPASAITTASPLVSLPVPWHSASTALATSSGEISRRWPVVSRAARRASAGDIPVFAAMRLTDCRVISVSTYPGQTALTVTPGPATDAMLTTRPQPRASIPGRNAWMHRNGPVAFTVRIRCQSSSVVFCTDAEWLIPALFTRMSTWPSRVSASRARVRTPSGSATSQGTAHARRPAAQSALAAASRPSGPRAATTTAAPASASARATASPMPRLPPVTTAPRPASVTAPAPRALLLRGSHPRPRSCGRPRPPAPPPGTRSTHGVRPPARSSSARRGSPR